MRGTTFVIACAALAMPAARAGATPPTAPCAYLSDSLVHEMTLRLESARSAVILHRSGRAEPVKFKTAVPCAYLNILPLAWARLDSAGATRFVRLLDLERRPPHGMFFTSACPRPEDHWDELSLTFPLGDDTVAVAVTPASGDASFTWQGCSAPAILGDRMAGFMSAALEALPADTALRAASVCTRPGRDSTGIPAGGVTEEPPRSIRRAALKYPGMAQSAGVEGTVLVAALVGRDGRVRLTRILASVPMLDQAAIRNVESWEFEPARRGDEPAEVWVQVPVRFTLR